MRSLSFCELSIHAELNFATQTQAWFNIAYHAMSNYLTSVRQCQSMGDIQQKDALNFVHLCIW